MIQKKDIFNYIKTVGGGKLNLLTITRDNVPYNNFNDLRQVFSMRCTQEADYYNDFIFVKYGLENKSYFWYEIVGGLLDKLTPTVQTIVVAGITSLITLWISNLITV